MLPKGVDEHELGVHVSHVLVEVAEALPLQDGAQGPGMGARARDGSEWLGLGLLGIGIRLLLGIGLDCSW